MASTVPAPLEGVLVDYDVPPAVAIARRESTELLLARIGKNPGAFGFQDDGDILLALAKDLDAMDTFGGVLRVEGYLCKYFGTIIAFFATVIGLIMFLCRAVEIGVEIVDYLTEQVKKLGVWGSIKGFLGMNKSKDEIARWEFSATRVGTNALYGLIIGWMGPTLGALVNAILFEILALLNISFPFGGMGGAPKGGASVPPPAGTRASSVPPPASTAQGPTSQYVPPVPSPSPEAPPTLKTAVGSVLGGLWDLIFGKKDASLDAWDAWARKVSSVTGTRPSEVLDELRDDIEWLQKINDVLSNPQLHPDYDDAHLAELSRQATLAMERIRDYVEGK